LNLVTTESNDYDRSITVIYVEKGEEINSKTKSKTNDTKKGKHHLMSIIISGGEEKYSCCHHCKRGRDKE
jgi:hypothetical protein